MSVSVQIKKGKPFYSGSFVPHFPEDPCFPNDLPKSAILFLSLVQERLEKLVHLADAPDADVIENADLDSLLGNVIQLLELSSSAAGLAEVNKQIGRVIQENNFRIKHKAEFDQLTLREKEVLTLLALGHSNKEVADQLFNSLETIKHHRKIIKSKLSITSTVELVQYGQAFNLI